MRKFAAGTVACAIALIVGVGVAAADKPTKTVDLPAGSFSVAAPGDTSRIIYLNRCAAGCTITKSGVNNALTNESTIPEGNEGQTFAITAFQHGDDAWNAVVACVREVYQPYDVEIVDQDPGQVPHHEVVAAGLGEQIGWGQAGGVGGSVGCDPSNNVISFAFLNGYPATQVDMMCQVIAQESAHSFGLPDHLFDCTDPMTYLTISNPDACPRRFFRNKQMPCGEFQENVPPCRCSGTRVNSHVQLLAVFGASNNPPQAPVVTITTPADGSSIPSVLSVGTSAESERGVQTVELYLNGWLWHTFEEDSSITPPFSWPSSYTLEPDGEFPDGVIDVEVRAYDDLGTMGSASIQVTKGAPCTDASQCLGGQKCEQGKCFWDQPSGELGDACEYDQFCLGPNTYDGQCTTVNGADVCVRDCFSGVNDDCPEGFYCSETNAATGQGKCIADDRDSGGCCNTGRGASPVAPIALGVMVGGLVLRRRRRVR